MEALANIKHQVVNMQNRETEAVEKVRAGIEITEQANINKTQVRHL